MGRYEYLDYQNIAAHARNLADHIRTERPDLTEENITAEDIFDLIEPLHGSAWAVNHLDSENVLAEFQQAMDDMDWEVQATLDGDDAALIATGLYAVLALNQTD